MKAKNNIDLGIDLGTATSAAAVVDSTGVPTVIVNMDGDLVTPTLVSLAGNEPTVGKIAKADKFLSPDYVAEQFKRYIGQSTQSGDPVALVTAPDNTGYTAVMLSAEVLNYLKKSAEKLYNSPIKKVVISVPAYFERAARQATRDAGLVAGFEEVFLIDEPTAAATYYGLSKAEEQTIGVFDFGGGTFDISLLSIKGGSTVPLAIDGDPECGGCNVDEAIFERLQQYLRDTNNVELSAEEDLAGWLEALEACRQAKEILAHRQSTTISVRVDRNRYSMELNREMLKDCSAQIIDTLTNCCSRVLEKADRKPEDIDKIVLIGGSTRLAFVADIIVEVFKQKPVTDADPDLAVTRGNAIIAAAHFGQSNNKILVDGKVYLASAIRPQAIAPKDLCVAAITELGEDERNVAIISSGAKLPYEATQRFTPCDHRTDAVQVKIIDGPAGRRSDEFTPFKDVQVRVKPTEQQQNDDRIEFKIAMDCEGLVSIKVRDTLLNESVPIELNFDTALSERDIQQQRKELRYRHKN